MTGLFQELSNSFNPTIKPTVTPRFKARFENDTGDTELVEQSFEETNQLESKYTDSTNEPSNMQPEYLSHTPEFHHLEVVEENPITSQPVAHPIENNTSVPVTPSFKEAPSKQNQLSEKKITSDPAPPVETGEKNLRTQKRAEQPLLKETKTIIEKSFEATHSELEVQTKKVVTNEERYKEPDTKAPLKSNGVPVKHAIHIGRIDVKASTPFATQPTPAVALTPTKANQRPQPSTRNQSKSKLTTYLGWKK